MAAAQLRYSFAALVTGLAKVLRDCPLGLFAALFAAMGELYTRFCIRANIVEQKCKELLIVVFCNRAKVRHMKTKDAINLAGSRKQLAALLGVAPISTYRWADLPQKHEDRLRVAKPSWFKAKKGTK